jgi:hypothetical protein
MNALTLKSLPAAEADLAYPLVQMIRPDISLSAWRRFVERRSAGAPEAGVTVLTDEDGYIQGIYTWTIQSGLGCERQFVTEEFGFVYAIDPRPAAELLLRSIEDLAREHACGAIRVGIPRDLEAAMRLRGGNLGALFAASGYRVESTNYVRSLESPRPRPKAIR